MRSSSCVDHPLGCVAAGHYVNWWVVHISVTNLIIIVVMVVVFVLALVLPFPGHDQEEDAR